MDPELQIDGDLQAWQEIEELANEFAAAFMILLSEVAGELSDRESVLLEGR
jgi:ubiquinone biosynthesis protein UbiJ